MSKSVKPKDYPSLAEHYKKKYPSHVKVLENSPLNRAKAHGINEYDIVAMCRQLDQFKAMCRMYESYSSMANLDQLPKIGLSVISANFGISPIALMAGVQPIAEEIGIVWFENFQAQTTRGNVSAGQNLISVTQGPDVYPKGFASDTSRQAPLVTTAVNGNHQAYNSGIAFPDSIVGLDPQRVTIYGTTTFNAGADAVTWPTMTPDPVSGQFGGSQKVNGTLYSVYGTIVYGTGMLSDLEFSAAPTAVNILSDFAVLEEAATDIPNANIIMQSRSVKAQFYAMKSTFGLFQQFVANQRWGMNIEDEMSKKLVQCLNNEICNQAIAMILANVPSGSTRTWVREPGTGIDYLSHKLSLPDALTDTSKLITNAAQRGHANVWIAGLNAAAVLEALPGFVKTFDDTTFGPHVFGTYRGSTVVRVPSSLLMNPDLIVGLYKGETPFEAPIVYCPFMPLTMTEVLIAGTNPLQYQKAAAQGCAIESIIPNFSCSLLVDQTGFQYSSI